MNPDEGLARVIDLGVAAPLGAIGFERTGDGFERAIDGVALRLAVCAHGWNNERLARATLHAGAAPSGWDLLARGAPSEPSLADADPSVELGAVRVRWGMLDQRREAWIGVRATDDAPAVERLAGEVRRSVERTLAPWLEAHARPEALRSAVEALPGRHAVEAPIEPVGPWARWWTVAAVRALAGDAPGSSEAIEASRSHASRDDERLWLDELARRIAAR